MRHRLATRVEDVEPACRNVEIAALIGAQAVGNAVDVWNQHPLVLSPAVLVDIVGQHTVCIRIRDIERLAIRSERDAVRPALRLRGNSDFAFRRHVEHAVEVQLARVGFLAKGRVGEEHVAVFSHHKIVRRIEAFAFELLGDDVNFTRLGCGANDAPRVCLARIDTPLSIDGIAFRATGITAKQHCRRLMRQIRRGCHAIHTVLGRVAEVERRVARRPYWSIGKLEAAYYFFNGGLGEILCGGCGATGQQDQRAPDHRGPTTI